MSDGVVYSGERTEQGAARAWVTRHGEQSPLPHLFDASPDGIEWGYHGSGPHDLARSILGDYLNDTNPNARLTRLLHDAVATLPTDRWTLTGRDIIGAFSRSKFAFELGNIRATDMVADEVWTDTTGAEFTSLCLLRHGHTDWGGDIEPDDAERNASALKTGARVLSSYPIPTTLATREPSLWVITEAVGDNGRRTATTVLFPSEY